MLSIISISRLIIRDGICLLFWGYDSSEFKITLLMESIDISSEKCKIESLLP